MQTEKVWPCDCVALFHFSLRIKKRERTISSLALIGGLSMLPRASSRSGCTNSNANQIKEKVISKMSYCHRRVKLIDMHLFATISVCYRFSLDAGNVKICIWRSLQFVI